MRTRCPNRGRSERISACHVARDLRAARRHPPDAGSLSRRTDLRCASLCAAGEMAEPARGSADRRQRFQPPRRAGRRDHSRRPVRPGRGRGVRQRVRLPGRGQSAQPVAAGDFTVGRNLGYAGRFALRAGQRPSDARHRQCGRQHHDARSIGRHAPRRGAGVGHPGNQELYLPAHGVVCAGALRGTATGHLG